MPASADGAGDGDDDEQQQGAPKQVTPPEPLPLDWTQIGQQQTGTNGPPPADRILHPWDVVTADVEFPPEDGELTIVGTAGQKITRMGTDLAARCGTDLTKLVLRSHLIRKMEGLGDFDRLQLLELYDNQIEVLEGLGGKEEDGADGGNPGATITVLDMSYNVIRDMGPVSLCPNLVELYLANNKLKTISGLRNLTKLRKVDLGANRIRVMPEDELSGLDSLEELWLGKNKIEAIGGISNLKKLRRLDVQANRLTSVENLTAQTGTLEELYLAHNAITNEGASCDTGLGLHFSCLNTLDLTRNRLTSTAPFAHLHALEELWLSGNEIATFEDVEPIKVLGTRDGACLEGIYLEMNPVAKEFEYRKRLASMLPSLKQIDANMIGGIAAHGIPSAGARMESMEARMRQLQEAAIERARRETEKSEK